MDHVHRIGFSVLHNGKHKEDGSFCETAAKQVYSIVFIHGLGGHPKKTWEGPQATALVSDDEDERAVRKQSRLLGEIRTRLRSQSPGPSSIPRGSLAFWPADFLPKDIPNARILTYGYKADIVSGFFQANNKNSLSQHSRDLSVKLEREIENQHPIIFVAHSLGGIIIKDALCRSDWIRARTKLIIFLGTPHRGSSFADWGEIASNLATAAFWDTNKRIVEVLEVNNEVLDRINDEFLDLACKSNFKVHSFQEARGIKGLKKKIVDDFSSKLGLPSIQETVETIDADHRDMARFGSISDSGYRDISGVLKLFIRDRLKATELGTAGIKANPQLHRTTTAISHKRYFTPSFEISRDLIGRENIIHDLEQKLFVRDRHCRVALVGLGGVGKTRIAIEYAYKYENVDLVSVFWIYAGSEIQIQKAYVKIGYDVGLIKTDDPAVDKLQLVKDWFESPASGNWLIIVDNADDVDLLFGSGDHESDFSKRTTFRLADYFPRRKNGSILLTTRNQKIGIKITTVQNVIAVPSMNTSDASNLLSDQLGNEVSSNHDLSALANALENLPLALVQAASFIKSNSISPHRYLEIYQSSDKDKVKLLNQNFEDPRRNGQSRNPVTVTWMISFEQIKKNDSLAAEILSLMSVLDKQAIPKDLLQLGDDTVDFEISLGTLKAFSLISSQKDASAFNIHRLVHLATRNWLRINRELDKWTSKAIAIMNDKIPNSYTHENEAKWVAYAPHALTLLVSHQLSTTSDSSLPATQFSSMPAEKKIDAEVKLRIATLDRLIYAHEFQIALPIACTAVASYKTIFGSEHEITLNSLMYQASILEGLKDYDEAEAILRQVIHSIEKCLGPDDSTTLKNYGALAMVLYKAKNYEESEKWIRRALAGKIKILGCGHMETLKSRYYLAALLSDQGKDKEAGEAMSQVLHECEKSLGLQNPYTLAVRYDLATFWLKQGKTEAAEKIMREALEEMDRAMMPEDLHNLGSIRDLARTLQRERRYDVALQLYSKAYIGHQRALDPTRSDTRSFFGELLETLDQFQKEERYDMTAIQQELKEIGLTLPPLHQE